LGSGPDGKTFVAPHAKAWELWDLEISHLGGFFLVSHSHQTQLCCDEKGGLYTQKHPSQGTWALVPKMPRTINASQIWTVTGIGAASIAFAAIMPFAIMGIVGAMGFTSGGIAAGSTAAGMMSAEAIASGGGVAAGGTVATLQSIGAAGLGAAGTTGAVLGGAVVGGTVAAGASTRVIPKSDGADKSANNGTAVPSNRPLSAWREWDD